MTNFHRELIEKAKTAKTAEELLALAKENDVEMTAEEATAFFAQLNPKAGELADDELDGVSGGGCGDSNTPEGPKVYYGQFTEGMYVSCGTAACAFFNPKGCGGAMKGIIHFNLPTRADSTWTITCRQCGVSFSGSGDPHSERYHNIRPDR